MSQGGIVVALVGAHAAAAKPVVETLLEGHELDDPRAPCVRVCFSAKELLDAPEGSRVVLLNAARDTEWLNLNRPVVAERSLAVFLWLTRPELHALHKGAPDFMDWISHRVEVPIFGEAIDQLRRTMQTDRVLALLGVEPSVALDGVSELSADVAYSELVEAMRNGPVAIHGLQSVEDLRRVAIADAQAGQQHHVLLVDPGVISAGIPVIDGRGDDWESAASRIEDDGTRHARLAAALQGLGAVRVPPRLHTVELSPVFIDFVDLIRRADPKELGPSIAAASLGVVRSDVAETWIARWLEDRFPAPITPTVDDIWLLIGALREQDQTITDEAIASMLKDAYGESSSPADE